MKCRKYPTCVIFLKSQGSKDIKHDILDCQIHIYTNTNAQIHKYKFTKTQIHKYSIWQNDRNTQHMLYFWTAGGSRMSKMIIPSILIRDTQLTFARSHQVYSDMFQSSRSRTDDLLYETAVIASEIDQGIGFQESLNSLMKRLKSDKSRSELN